MTRSLLRLALTALVALAAMPACSSSHSAEEDGGVVVPDGSIGRDAPAMSCGGEICGAGETCCTGCPGAPVLGCFDSCPDIACPIVWESCEDALDLGTTGEACAFDDTCSRSEGCCSTFATCSEGVLRLDQACAPGCFACASSDDCDPGSYCDFGGLGCGGPGTCLPRPTACDADCPGVCSCDGTTYCNACSANAAGASVAREGACDLVSCAPQDARGSGACALFLGYVWDGESCTGIGGCSCVGVDCGALYERIGACEAAHSACTTDPCAAMDARGDGLCDAFFGYTWDGASCSGVSGCSCEGDDCDRLFESPGACAAAHRGCGPESCVAQEARGEGDCRLLLGYLWNGNMCVAIGGCSCVGPDCDALYEDRSSCDRAHGECIVTF